MKAMSTAMIAGMCALLASSAVRAQAPDLLVQPRGYEMGYPGVPVDAQPTWFSYGGSCVKLCSYDLTPCDPDYWKRADRRCNYNQLR